MSPGSDPEKQERDEFPLTCKWEDVVTYLEFLPIDPTTPLNVFCTTCCTPVAEADEGKVLYCGHIYHAPCLEAFYKEADTHFNAMNDGCFGCGLPNRHPECACRLPCFDMPPTIRKVNNLPRVCALGGQINASCNTHLLRQSLEALCNDAREYFGDSKVVAATGSSQICWASDKGCRFGYTSLLNDIASVFPKDEPALRWKCEMYASRLRGMTEMTDWIEYRFSTGMPRFLVGKIDAEWEPIGSCRKCLEVCCHHALP